MSDNPYNPLTGEGDYAIFVNGIPRSKTNEILTSLTWKKNTEITQANLHDSFSIGKVSNDTAGHTYNYAVSTRVQWFLPLSLIS